MTDDTIVAPATGPVRSAVSVIRVSGPQSGFLLETLAGRRPEPRRAELATLRDPDGGSVIDHGLILFFPSPASFTGEDSAEFQIHGSPASVKHLLKVLTARPGVRLAEPGEFTRRALENGKMDLIAAEALADLIDSDTERQRQSAIDRADGRFSNQIRILRDELLALRSLVEAEIDFSDEADIPASLAAEIYGKLQHLGARLHDMLQRSIASEIMRDGFQVVLAGRVNAGKSTLMNALAGRDVAIVSSIPGTTRDILEVKLDLDGYAVVLRDLAGFRESDDAIERVGIERARQAVRAADLVLWLDPADGESEIPEEILQDLPAEKSIRIRSKSDLRNVAPANQELAISAHTGDGLEGLLAEIKQRCDRLWRPHEQLWHINARQRACLEKALSILQSIPPGLAAPIEFVAEDLRLMSRALSQVLGDMDVEEILGAIFSRFCIGK